MDSPSDQIYFWQPLKRAEIHWRANGPGEGTSVLAAKLGQGVQMRGRNTKDRKIPADYVEKFQLGKSNIIELLILSVDKGIQN